MRENNAEDVTDLEIQAKTWDKLEKKMKLVGLREGAAKGRDESLQEGFDAGYTAGFELGEHIGQLKGILRCPAEMTGCKFSRENVMIKSDEVCVMCLKEKNNSGENKKNESHLDMDEIELEQQKLSSEIINDLKKSNYYMDKT